MEKIVIEGGKRLSGELRIHGSKNSALPILAAAVLTNKPCVIHNCPRLTDVDAAIPIGQNSMQAILKEGSSDLTRKTV